MKRMLAMHKSRGLFNVKRLILLVLMTVVLSASLAFTVGVVSAGAISAKPTSLTPALSFDGCVKCGF